MSTTIELDETNKAEIEQLLMGRTVTKVGLDNDSLLLDDGTILLLRGHEGGCSCGAGDYELTELNGVDNIITKVEFVDSPDDDNATGDGPGFYTIFVFADNQRINLATFEGSDGNGYYGTGYSIVVTPASKET